jgi:hypothetical protein
MPFCQQVSDTKILYYLFVYITCLQAFAKAAKLAIISIKPALRIRATSPNRRPACQMRLAKGGKTRKNNEKICGKMLPHK